ncbi:hypothetical protein BV25DRAFT_1834597 [Artomyces pyxidatus]|uniref:Uncharacterized protein n=1 Tax=Artomyces pyxidatus TaxID=48021 RepID=A0ACB8TIZ7_9AGAM|nr:hypothetical protein BV25DRAFT_1834597 [Artomyces pyxidatus]
MSPYRRPQNNRRRSQSASAPGSPSSARRVDDPWRPSTKRTHPHTPSCKDIALSNVPHKWDVDLWRRGKRPRMDRSSTPSNPDIDMDAPSSATRAPSLRAPVFASTSAAFNFFPSRPQRSTRSARSSTSSPPHPKQLSPSMHIDSDLSALHSNAFVDLRQSIAKGDEGFVQRMRAWESARTRTPAGAHLPRRAQPPPSAFYHRGRSSSTRILSGGGSDDGDYDEDEDNEDEDEDEDVQIFSGDSSTADTPSLRAVSPSRSRARSLGPMDLDSPRASLPPAPVVQPALSHTVASSTNSSLVSLPLPQSVPAHASREEKAIAALNLALANGAAGLNDYGAVREALGVLGLGSVEGISEVGEMWH